MSTASYEIRDAGGRLVAYHVRKDNPDGSKQVAWKQPDGTWGLNGTPLAEMPLYGAEMVSDAGEDELIVLVEGEKARDALEEAGIPVVGSVTGASGTPGAQALEVLRGRRVCLWPDHDDPGRAHMERIGAALQGVAAEVLFYTWYEAGDKGADAADHPAVGSASGSAKAADRLLTDLEGSPRYKPAPGSGPEIGRLLSEVEAERVSWLWGGRIPLGKLTLLDGAPGTGKSAMTTDLATRVSVGRAWPDGGECEAGGVVICSAEDGLADTIRPRFDAAGGDASKVLALATVPDGEGSERLISIPEDLDTIRRGLFILGEWGTWATELFFPKPFGPRLKTFGKRFADQHSLRVEVRFCAERLAGVLRTSRSAYPVTGTLSGAAGDRLRTLLA